ncbi:DUF2500 domain-containing protein [Bacillus sp. CHD6a]|uniref:DUF2500 domain-containing protein n=1 Tax=Bacillus sp. CHD6a TaxID=1643452 RepID=UPI0006CDAC3A|nr:DUF2500 domain-containing protein [Bacillus sp. CHD6a]KPB06025.1 hypothetical protein AAV98_03645 [Bacillus sp. CHD6a]
MSDPYMGSGDFMFQIGPIFIGIVFVLIIGVILVSVFQGIGQWHKNEQSPRLSVPAVVTSKRIDVTKRSNMNHHHHSSSSHTSYYVTFEFESGDRSEFHLSGKEYGLLSEDDNGVLSFQGTRYLGFERNKVSISGGEYYQDDYK